MNTAPSADAPADLSPHASTIDLDAWNAARAITRNALRSGLQVAVASVNADGSPHVTPIGSLFLAPEPGVASWLDVLNARLRRNVDRDPRVTILAVDARKRYWLSSLVRGQFDTLPGLQLTATVGERRPTTDAEVERFQRAVGPLARTPGGKALWSSVGWARDLAVTELRPIRMGPMTSRGA